MVSATDLAATGPHPSIAEIKAKGVHAARIDDGVGAGAHAAGSNGMQVRDTPVADILDQLRFRPYRWARHGLLGDEGLEGRLLGELPRLKMQL